jgi:serine O-acetyltransferase
MMEQCVLRHQNLTQALANVLADRIASATLPASSLQTLFEKLHAESIELTNHCATDLHIILERDPASDDLCSAFLFHKGYLALQCYRFSHVLWNAGRKRLAIALQSRASEVFAVDIHPAARIGSAAFIDHGTGLVIGETAVVGRNVSLFQCVTLGGTGKEIGDRHPKIGDGVVIYAGATLLGNIVIGKDARIGASSVVLCDVLADTTMAGVPARRISRPDPVAPTGFAEKELEQVAS